MNFIGVKRGLAELFLDWKMFIFRNQLFKVNFVSSLRGSNSRKHGYVEHPNLISALRVDARQEFVVTQWVPS